MKRELEALLFATDSPLNLSRLKKIFTDVDASEIKAAVRELQEEYDAAGHAFDLSELRAAGQAGAHMIELDVCLSRDRHQTRCQWFIQTHR